MPSPKAFSALRKREPWDWPGFARTVQWQPVPQWLVLSALAYPFSRAFPVVARAACEGDARTMLVKTALVVYTMFAPALVVAAVYGLAGRRRLTGRPHRMMGDVMLALLVVLTAADAFVVVGQVRAQWETLGPALGSLRAACWPPRP
ncbi:MAG: hypothetical protein HY079_09555 [Elusimicrobia bacterium]|nr:hypothetical protein [Elusimicrobiota bacterium]